MSEWVVGRPAPPLRPLIDAYIGYRVAGVPPGPNATVGLRGPNAMVGLHRGLPSRHLTVIVSIGEPIEVVAQTDPRQPPASYRFVVSGLQASSALIASPSSQEGVAIELTPLGSRALLGVPARALWDTSVEAADVVGPPATELWERLHHAGDWAGRFVACDDVLLRLLAATRAAPVPSRVAGAWDVLVASGGTIGVNELAERVGWSRRHLTHRFAGEFGLSPKLAGRVVRFERAARLLRSPRRPTIAEVAATCGYYDQPHLNRDFVELAGCPPGEWLETELPSVQDDGASRPAGSTA
ncbi:MAG: helix-turn-helix domain-containing protein [Actinomycetota bacterium]|nr:helix-turn-helix domain-containing protein [Actinomycetota bacterium]